MGLVEIDNNQYFVKNKSGSIPKGWRYLKFTDVAELKHGFQFRENHFSDKGVIVVKIGSLVDSGSIQFDNASYIPLESFRKNFQEYQLRKGDVLMALTGATLGKVSIIEDDKFQLVQNYRVGNFIPLEASCLAKKYLYYLLQSHLIQNKIKNLINEAAQPNVGKADFEKIYFPLPPLPEQKKIAKILSTWDEAIALTEKLIAAKEKLKKGLMQQLLTGKKRFKEFENKRWIAVKLGDIADVVMGQSPDSKYYNTKSNGLYLIQGNADIKERVSAPKIWTSHLTKNCFINDILMTVRAPVGSVAKSQHDACIGRGVCAIRSKKVDHEFLYQKLLEFEPKWIKYEQGSTFTSVGRKEIKSLSMNIPEDCSEQKRISAFLSSLDKKIQLLEDKLEALKNQKKGLMQQLLTGKVRLQVKD